MLTSARRWANVQSKAVALSGELLVMIEYASVATVVTNAAEWLRLVLEALGALTIAAGAFAAVAGIVRARRLGPIRFTDTRFTLARYLALALEFQLAADILSTGVSPQWEEIGQLAAIATIRTGLNYFLTREIDSDRATGAKVVST
jgi:uncharacterized membrane protein